MRLRPTSPPRLPLAYTLALSWVDLPCHGGKQHKIKKKKKQIGKENFKEKKEKGKKKAFRLA